MSTEEGETNSAGEEETEEEEEGEVPPEEPVPPPAEPEPEPEPVPPPAEPEPEPEPAPVPPPAEPEPEPEPAPVPPPAEPEPEPEPEPAPPPAEPEPEPAPPPAEPEPEPEPAPPPAEPEPEPEPAPPPAEPEPEPEPIEPPPEPAPPEPEPEPAPAPVEPDPGPPPAAEPEPEPEPPQKVSGGEVEAADLVPTQSMDNNIPAPPPPSLEAQSEMAPEDEDAKYRTFTEVDDTPMREQSVLLVEDKPNSGRNSGAEEEMPVSDAEAERMAEAVAAIGESDEEESPDEPEPKIAENAEKLRELLDTDENPLAQRVVTQFALQQDEDAILEKVNAASQTMDIGEKLADAISSKAKATCEPIEPPTDNDLIYDMLTGREQYPCNECEQPENQRCSSDDIFDFVADVIINLIEFSINNIETLATKLINKATEASQTYSFGQPGTLLFPVGIQSQSQVPPPPSTPMPSAPPEFEVLEEIPFENLETGETDVAPLETEEFQ